MMDSWDAEIGLIGWMVKGNVNYLDNADLC